MQMKNHGVGSLRGKASKLERYWSLLKFLYYTSFLTPCALPSVQLFSNAKAKIRTYSRTSKFSTQKNDQ
jgi:hypothetical protein